MTRSDNAPVDYLDSNICIPSLSLEVDPYRTILVLNPMQILITLSLPVLLHLEGYGGASREKYHQIKSVTSDRV